MDRWDRICDRCGAVFGEHSRQGRICPGPGGRYHWLSIDGERRKYRSGGDYAARFREAVMLQLGLDSGRTVCSDGRMTRVRCDEGDGEKYTIRIRDNKNGIRSVQYLSEYPRDGEWISYTDDLAIAMIAALVARHDGNLPDYMLGETEPDCKPRQRPPGTCALPACPNAKRPGEYRYCSMDCWRTHWARGATSSDDSGSPGVVATLPDYVRPPRIIITCQSQTPEDECF